MSASPISPAARPGSSPRPSTGHRRRGGAVVARIRKITKYAAYSVFSVFAILVLWLAVTAPLNQSLQPIAAPSYLVVAADGADDRPARRDPDRAGRCQPPAALCRPGLHRDRGPALLPPSRRRSLGDGARGLAQLLGRPGHRGRQHDQPAARQDQLHRRRADDGAQGAGGADHDLAGGVAEQGGDPQPLSLQRLFRQQRLRPARRRPLSISASSRSG